MAFWAAGPPAPPAPPGCEMSAHLASWHCCDGTGETRTQMRRATRYAGVSGVPLPAERTAAEPRSPKRKACAAAAALGG
eukprot:scaffold9783_cov127-Isochrysis_galbana.AAC.9